MKRLLTLVLAFCCLGAAAQKGPAPFEQTWTKGPQWLQDAVIYQVYPSSFKDSDGNGIGDIPGVLSKMDYIASLGVTAIWFNPLFVSGWVDGGYDVIDFYKVDPRFGTNDDLVALVEAAHARGIKVMLDLVAGHTSDKHPWFLQSKQGTNLQYSDYFIWSDRLPNAKAEADLKRMLSDPNYMQNTTGKWMRSSAPRGKFYMKNFYACQPALNYGYANPDPSHPWEQGVGDEGPQAVRRELRNILAFWFGKGVDGFRVDMAASLVKNDRDKSAILQLWREVRTWMDATYPDRVLMAEWGDPVYCLASGFNIDMELNSTKSAIRRMYFDRKHQADGGCYFSLNGGQPSLKDLYGNPWRDEEIDRKTTPFQMLTQWYDHYTKAVERSRNWGYFASITGNHDHLRFNTGARNTPAQLKVTMAWIMSMPLPILYYGDEIGLRSLADLPSVEGSNHNGKERSGGRSPMQWNSDVNAGFSTCDPEEVYLPVCPEWTPATSYPQYLRWKASGSKNPTAKGLITVESQDGDPSSLLNFTRTMIALRKSHKAFWSDSEFIPVVTAGVPYPMVFLRTDGEETYLVALNPTGVSRTVTIAPQTAGSAASTILVEGKGSYKATRKGDTINLAPTSVLIVKVK